MPPRLRGISPRGRLHRVGRAPDPWVWPDWAHAADDGTFGNRWDDPRGAYRVLYAASERLGALLEVLARFRPDPHVQDALARIAGEPDGALPPGHLHASWLTRRRLGEATVEGRFADVGHSESLARLRLDLADRIVHHGIEDLDASAIRRSVPRRFTQELSRYVYAQTARGGRRAFDGIAYRSRLGDELRNWALFEPVGPRRARPRIRDACASRIRRDDPDLRRALTLHGLRLV